MLNINSPIQNALDAGVFILRGMILFDFASGFYGFWDGSGPLPYNGVTYQPHNSLLKVSPLHQSGDLSSSPMSVTLRAVPEAGLTPDVLATIENEVYKNRPVIIYFAYFDPVTRQMLSIPMIEWEGEVDEITHEQQGGNYTLVAALQTRDRDYTRKGGRRRGHQDQQDLYPSDSFLQNAEVTTVEREYFGQETPTSAKKD